MKVQKTYCRICEAHCGLEVTVGDDEQIVSVKPDKQHPVSKGYACIKGTAAGALHHDPDRVNYPMKRINGEWQRIGWDQAIEEIGAKVSELRGRHGNRSIAMYQGNPTYFSFQNIMYSTAFLESIGSPNIFASHSVDGNNKYEAATHIYGRSMVHPVVDLDKVNFFMCFGSNPVVSQMSFIQVLNPIQKFKAIEARGGKVVIVDPRRTETAAKAGEHVFIKPGTDVYLLLAMLHVITHEQLFDAGYADKYAQGVRLFIENSKLWTPERVEKISGILAEDIRRLALEYRDADGAALYMSTGVNMGPFGTLSYWLVQGLNFITGNVDRKGGLLLPRGAFDALKLAELLGLGGFDEHRTLASNWHRVAGCFPSSVLAEEIEIDHPDRIRALFVSAGNPVHSIPQGRDIGAALDKLELVVSIDIYHNETAMYADYILPATDMLERSDYPVSHMVLQEVPFAQYTPEMVSPKYERRPEWQIYSDLAIACGAKIVGKTVCNSLPHINRLIGKIPILGRHFGGHAIQPDHLLSLLLRWGGRTSLKALKAQPEGLLLEATQAETFIGKRVPTPDGKLQLWPEKITQDLLRLQQVSERFVADTNQLYLIGQRHRRSHNSWMHNNPHIKQPEGNQALMHPDDAATRGIVEQSEIQIRSAQGAVQLKVLLTSDMRPGVIAVPHGWGHQQSKMARAAALKGVNINEVVPGGEANMEPVSGQAIMLGHLVDVECVESSAEYDSEEQTSAEMV
jgi:formate dehydrogenase